MSKCVSSWHVLLSYCQASTVQQEAMMEHLFAVRVEKVQGLSPLQSTVWGEADCYIQYSFPSQEGDPAPHLDPDLIESSKACFTVQCYSNVFE